LTTSILERVVGGRLPMQFSGRADIEHLQDLRDAGYLRVSFDGPEGSCTHAAVTAITPLGCTAIRYFGFSFGTPPR
jgi:predicted HAD superfamily phosphohydrolase